MLIRIGSAKCIGIQAVPITVEVNISSGIGIHLVGLADTAVRESLLRTITALQSMGFHIPGKKIVINLAPADMHKSGSGYDVPIALGIIAASEQMPMTNLEKYVILGELGLDGTVRSVPGALPVAEMAQNAGCPACILPFESATEAMELDRIRIYGVRNLSDVLRIVCDRSETDGCDNKYGDLLVCPDNIQADMQPHYADTMDFSEIVGQEAAKRGLEIAAAGGHNALLVGPPGAGKSSLAKAMCAILPPMTKKEAIETSKIYSVAGLNEGRFGLMRTRPFRTPHISASIPALIGGGSENIIPGEVSLAHNGVLFLDEFCEMPRKTVEVLRAPLEDRRVILSRLRTKVEYPAAFTLIAATNPCPCGYYGEGDRCTCTVGQRNAYLAKLSGPLIDRIDIQLWLHPVSANRLMGSKAGESSASVAARVLEARKMQKKRFADDDIFCNSQMNNRQIKKYCILSTECADFLEQAIERTRLSARACTRIIKLARTIADLENASDISIQHLAEALSYRFLDKQNM